jgi:Ca-activated chloride channel family protein
LLYRWTGDRLRFLLPTTIAPRYGASPHAAPRAPVTSMTVEHRFALVIEVRGLLSNAQFHCPSHALAMTQADDCTTLSFVAEREPMDRDVVIEIRAPGATRSFAVSGLDGDDQMAALASFQPFIPGLQSPRRLDLVVVVDCSGSMQGDSIAQACAALQSLLERLTPADRLAMLGFGSSIWEWADHLQICKKDVMTEARSFARSLQANLGGTEIGPALGRARQILGRSRDGHILLITDGEVSNWQSIVSKASRSRHRIFAVGVGSAVSEAFLRELSQSTSGACELTAPGEDIALPVLRQFDRMRAARSRRVEILWPEGATQLTPAHTPLVFEGDTLIASAVMPLSRRLGTAESAAASAGTAVTLRIETETGQIIDQTLPITVATSGESGPEQRSSVARIAAAQRLKLLDDAAGLACALRYQLVSRWTHAIVVAERAPEDKTDGLPALRVVPQMMAAGWSGMGIVAASLKVAESSGIMYCMTPAVETDHKDLPLLISLFVKSINLSPDRADLDPTLLSLMCAPMSASRDIDKLSDELGVRPMTMLYAPLLLHLAMGPLKTHLTYEAHAAIQSLYADYEAWHARLRDAIEHARDLDRVVRPLADSIKKVREPGRQLYETLIAIHLQLEALEADVPRVTRRFIDAIDHHRQSTQSSEQTGSMSG